MKLWLILNYYSLYEMCWDKDWSEMCSFRSVLNFIMLVSDKMDNGRLLYKFGALKKKLLSIYSRDVKVFECRLCCLVRVFEIFMRVWSWRSFLVKLFFNLKKSMHVSKSINLSKGINGCWVVPLQFMYVFHGSFLENGEFIELCIRGSTINRKHVANWRVNKGEVVFF